MSRSSCKACSGLPDRGLKELEIIGGSHYPYSSPWGELRKCRRCGAYFCYTLDHDNGQGSGPDEESIVRIDAARARKLAEEATVVARRLLAHFSAEVEDITRLPASDNTRAPRLKYAQGCVDDSTRELERLARELALLGGGAQRRRRPARTT